MAEPALQDEGGGRTTCDAREDEAGGVVGRKRGMRRDRCNRQGGRVLLKRLLGAWSLIEPNLDV